MTEVGGRTGNNRGNMTEVGGRTGNNRGNMIEVGGRTGNNRGNMTEVGAGINTRQTIKRRQSHRPHVVAQVLGYIVTI